MLSPRIVADGERDVDYVCVPPRSARAYIDCQGGYRFPSVGQAARAYREGGLNGHQHVSAGVIEPTGSTNEVRTRSWDLEVWPESLHVL